MFQAEVHDSPTSDEPPHLLSGYVFLKYGADYIDIEHPLLAKGLAAAPLLFTTTKFNLTDPNYSSQKQVINVGKMFKASRTWLAYQGNNPDSLLFWGRLPMLWLTLAFGLVIFLLGSKLFGPWVGTLAVFFYATEPLVLANGPLVNTDLAAAGFVITTIYALILYSERQSPKRLLFLIVAIVAAFLSKYSTFYLAPVVLGFVYVIAKPSGKSFKHLAILVGSTLGLIWLFYATMTFRDRGLLAIFPASYLSGLAETFKAVSTTKRFTYLLGESYFGSRIYYFPLLILVKTQLLTLLGVVLSLFYFWRKKLVLPKLQFWIFFLPLILYFALSLLSKFNIGLRHVLPIYPFLFILAAAGFMALIHNIRGLVHKNWVSLATIVVISVIILGRGYSLVTTYPHFLSYYNVIVGTDNGWKIADDANYDWGQDVKRLADYVGDNNIQAIGFDNYTGLYAAKDYYHLPVFQFSPDQTNYKGYVALSTSTITFHQNKSVNYNWIVDNYKPIAKAGQSIFIYKIE